MYIIEDEEVIRAKDVTQESLDISLLTMKKVEPERALYQVFLLKNKINTFYKRKKNLLA